MLRLLGNVRGRLGRTPDFGPCRRLISELSPRTGCQGVLFLMGLIVNDWCVIFGDCTTLLVTFHCHFTDAVETGMLNSGLQRDGANCWMRQSWISDWCGFIYDKYLGQNMETWNCMKNCSLSKNDLSIAKLLCWRIGQSSSLVRYFSRRKLWLWAVLAGMPDLSQG